MKKVIIIILCAVATLTAACTIAVTIESTPSPALQIKETPAPPSPTPVPTVPPETAPAITAVIEVKDGDTLERDIIPQLTGAFSMTENEVKEALAGAESSLIGKAKGFRRMEGMIVPGAYEIEDEDISYWIDRWTEGSEQRYERISEGIGDKNELSPGEHLALASIVEWETTLVDDYERLTADVLLNRLMKRNKLECCATVEYALGYQRPYVTISDTKIESEYNTNIIKALPPGPICCMDNESLASSISKPFDTKVFFFFYDYVRKEILAFTNLTDFRAAVKESKALYESTIDPNRFVKIEDKREYFATGG